MNMKREGKNEREEERPKTRVGRRLKKRGSRALVRDITKKRRKAKERSIAEMVALKKNKMSKREEHLPAR